MSEAQRWVVVDPADPSKMLGGPYLWNGRTGWTPPVTGVLVLEATWLAAQPVPVPDPE